MTCFGTGLRKLFFVCVIAAFGVIAVSSGFGLGILLAALALVAPYKCKIPHFLPLLLIEVQPRYAYLPQIFLYIAAAAGISVLMRKKQASA